MILLQPASPYSLQFSICMIIKGCKYHERVYALHNYTLFIRELIYETEITYFCRCLLVPHSFFL